MKHPVKDARFCVLLVEDNPVDILMIREALHDSEFNIRLFVAEDGDAAVDFLHRNCISCDTRLPCPDLILLDLNLPKKSGREILTEIKQNPYMLHIPVIILTTSEDPRDICETYALAANCFITKPMDVDRFAAAVREIEEFWTQIVKLPPRGGP